MKNPQHTPNENGVNQSTEAPKTSKSKIQFENLRRFFGKAAALAILTMLATSCEKETPEEIVSNQAPQNKVFTATVVDADGDGEKNDVQLNFTATDDKAVTSKKVLLTANEYSRTIDFGTATEKMIKNLENADYAAEFVAEDAQGLADSDTKNFKVDMEPPVPTIAIATPTITPITPDAVVDGAEKDTNIATVSFSFELDGVTKTADELRALGYTVEFSLNNSAVKFDDDQNPTQVKTAEKLDRDGANNTDPENLKNLEFKAKATVTKDGVSQETESAQFSDEKNEGQDFTNKYGQLIELENGKNAPEYDAVVDNYTNLIGNDPYPLSTPIIQALADAAGDDFGVETVYVSPDFPVPFLTYKGQKIASKCIGWLINAARRARLIDKGQNIDMSTAIKTDGLAEYLKLALQNFEYVTDADIIGSHADIGFTQLDAAIGGSGGQVHQNIDNGLY